MVLDRVLKVNGWILYTEQERGVYFGKQYLEWYWDHYLECNRGQHREQNYEP